MARPIGVFLYPLYPYYSLFFCVCGKRECLRARGECVGEGVSLLYLLRSPPMTDDVIRPDDAVRPYSDPHEDFLAPRIHRDAVHDPRLPARPERYSVPRPERAFCPCLSDP